MEPRGDEREEKGRNEREIKRKGEGGRRDGEVRGERKADSQRQALCWPLTTLDKPMPSSPGFAQISLSRAASGMQTRPVQCDGHCPLRTFDAAILNSAVLGV